MDPDDGHHRVAEKLLRQMRERRMAGVKISALALHELELNLKGGNILIRGERATTEDIAEFFTDLGRLLSLYRLAVLPLTCEQIAEAANLRRAHNMTFYDSHHATSAMLYDSKIISTDGTYGSIPDLERVDPYARAEVQTVAPDRANVIAKIGKNKGPGLLLSGHIDVVLAGDLELWTARAHDS